MPDIEAIRRDIAELARWVRARRRARNRRFAGRWARLRAEFLGD